MRLIGGWWPRCRLGARIRNRLREVLIKRRFTRRRRGFRMQGILTLWWETRSLEGVRIADSRRSRCGEICNRGTRGLRNITLTLIGV